MPIIDPTPQDLERWRVALIALRPDAENHIRTLSDFDLWFAYRRNIEKPPQATVKLRKRYQAKVSTGNGQRVSLGYFATPEERDAAVFAFKIGVRQ